MYQRGQRHYDGYFRRQPIRARSRRYDGSGLHIRNRRRLSRRRFSHVSRRLR